MALSGVCGLETEYGLMAGAGGGLCQAQAALALLQCCQLSGRVAWDADAESPGRDARGPSHSVAGDADLPAANDPGFMLANGARLYVDCGHPEYATPECADPHALLLADRAGELVLEGCRHELNRRLPLDQAVRLIKNNGDYQGHSYACHENYSVATGLYRALFDGRPRPLLSQLVPFLVSRIVVSGAGKVGSDNGRPPAPFQLSQRADFFEALVGLQTTHHRPLVNSRDEPHGDPSRFRRLHVILGDANMAEVSTYLKVGSLLLLLRMLEEDFPLPDLALADPLSALLAISRDPSCRQCVPLADGRCLTAPELQLEFAAAAQRYAGSGSAPRWAAPFVARWADVLRRLVEDPRQLAGTLDWVIKLELLDRWRQRKRLAWESAELREIDLRYHDIDRQAGIFYQLEAAGAVERLARDEDIRRAVDEPPSPTRAAARSALMRHCRRAPVAASWGTLVWREAGEPPRRLALDDPTQGPSDDQPPTAEAGR